MEYKSTFLAYKYALIAVLLWSTVATAFKITLQYLTSVELLLFAIINSTLLFIFILYRNGKLHLLVPYIRENPKRVFLMGAINPFFYYIVLFEAYSLLPAQEAQAINYTWALMLAFLSVPFLKHKLTISDVVAGVICYFGVLVIATKGDLLGLEFSNATGVLYALISTVLWALYWLISTKNTFHEPLVVLLSNFLVGLPLIIVYYLFTQEISFPPIEGIIGAVYVGLFEMGLAFVFWLKAMNYTPKTSTIANLIFISPFLSLIFISLFLDEKIYFSTIIGLIFIILGLLVQQKKLLNTKK
jgi:drug/metabolite transporter (DMT)-like permease